MYKMRKSSWTIKTNRIHLYRFLAFSQIFWKFLLVNLNLKLTVKVINIAFHEILLVGSWFQCFIWESISHIHTIFQVSSIQHFIIQKFLVPSSHKIRFRNMMHLFRVADKTCSPRPPNGRSSVLCARSMPQRVFLSCSFPCNKTIWYLSYKCVFFLQVFEGPSERMKI